MLKIKTLEYKNLLSTGNSPIKIDFSKPTTLIVGENGAGKSTVISALIFALYGKDFRGINKGGLVNSINKKKLETTIEFDVSGKSYKLIRGIKPDIFEIYENGKLLEIQAAKKDQQEFFESHILKFPYNAFKQIVTIGSGEYVQFMRLTAAQRRSFIENILPDVSIFNVMSDLLKADLTEIKNQESDTRSKINYLSGVLTSLYKAVALQKEQTDKEKLEIKTSIEDKINQIKEFDKNIEELTDMKLSLGQDQTKYDKLLMALNKLNVAISTVESQIISEDKKVKSISDMTTCPTCFQDVGHEHKNNIRLKYKESIDSNITKKEDFETKLNQVKDSIDKLKKINDEAALLDNKIMNIVSDKKYLHKEIESLKEKYKSISENNKELGDEVSKNENDMKLLNSQSEELRRKIDLYQMKLVLLKDTGIKSKVISNYLEMINKNVNQYLDLFEFNVEFYLDETFNESLKSRYRDEFKYNNFSEGEKSRIDLSLLFTWRDIARLNNNLNCNLLFFDEIFDSSLDSNGIADLKIIFDKYSDMNIMVISHRDDVSEQFENVLRFKKIKNFTTMDIE